jgi:hypothetical protein
MSAQECSSQSNKPTQPPATIAAGAGTLNMPTARNEHPTRTTYSELSPTGRAVRPCCIVIDSAICHSMYTAVYMRPTAAAFTPAKAVCRSVVSHACASKRIVR